jgi:hypothetical protein
MEAEWRFTLSTNRNSTFSLSLRPEESKSFRTPVTSSSLPNNSAATAACDFVQNGHWFWEEV